MTPQRGRGERSTAEWVTFGLSALVLLLVVALIFVEAATTEAPAEPVAKQSGPARRSGDRFFVPVEVRNEGDETASEVQVVAVMTVNGREVRADQIIDFLAGDETAKLEFAFDEDPASGSFSVRVSGYQEP